MKIKLILFFLFVNIVCIEQTIAQNLTLADLTNICNKKNWEDVDKYLFARGWTYSSSSKGDSEHYNTVTWSYNYNSYNEKASAWFYLYNYDGLPSKITYDVFNKPSYSLIYNNISSSGFKSVESIIEDDIVTAKYANTNYFLEIYNQKRVDDDDYYSSGSITAYGIRLVKKSGVYDPDNGKKYTYYDDGRIQLEYTLKDGLKHGIVKLYYENGTLHITGNCTNGEANGKFTEFDLDGVKIAEWEMKNDLKTGKQIQYENGKASSVENYKLGYKEGESISYTYDENGKISYILKGNYKDDLENGNWKFNYINDKGIEETVREFNFIEGRKNGAFKDYVNDTIVIGYYADGLLNGQIKKYYNVLRDLLGTNITFDTSRLTLIEEGRYQDDKKLGKWKYYDMSSSLRTEGYYTNDKKSGEWKYYNSKFSDEKGDLPYSQKLYLIENYSDGKLDGKSTRLSTLRFEKYKCNEVDSCSKFVFKPLKEIMNFKKGNLDGAYQQFDSLGNLIMNGNFKNDEKNGEWEYKFYDYTTNELTETQTGNFVDGLKEGKWTTIDFLNDSKITIEYKRGQLDGYVMSLNENGKPYFKKLYKNNSLIEYTHFDSLGINIIMETKLLGDYSGRIDISYKNYNDTGYVVTEFQVSPKETNGKWKFFNLNDYLINISEFKSIKYGKYLNYSFGKPIEIGSYINDQKNGLWTSYYYNKDIKILQNFSNNIGEIETYKKMNDELYSGTFEFINQSEYIKEERKIKEGVRNGKTTYIDLTTKKKIKKENYKDGVLD